MDKDVTIPTDILDDLSSRFIINVPEEERCTVIRTCFQIELAHWFYLDFYCVERPELPVCTIRSFARLMFNHVPSLQQHSSQADSIVATWQGYKHSVPTYGAILMDETLENVLLVQGYYARTNWSFPKGKVNKEEQPHVCAIREVLEETGFDITSLIDQNQFVTHFLHDQLIKLYIVTGVPNDTKFQPVTRNEIKKIQWFPIKDLPDSRKDQKPNHMSNNTFFMVIPFVRKIKNFIAKRQEQSSVEPISDSESGKCADLKMNLDFGNDELQKKQQHIFAQFSANTMSCYFPSKDTITSHKNIKTISSTHHTYVTPPRMLKQKSLKQNSDFRSVKTIQQTPENEIEAHGSQYQRVEPRKDQNKNEKLFWSKTWSNFKLDQRALVACFNENMTKAYNELLSSQS